MSEKLPTFPSPTACPFIEPRRDNVIRDNFTVNCGVDREGVTSESETTICRDNFSRCEKYSKKVYEDLMSAIRDGINEVAEKNPESLLRVFAPTVHSSTTNE